jgi:nitrous oxide reductase accessory protein NosL
MPEANWLDAGVACLVLTDQLMATLGAKGIISDDERGAIIDAAIQTLESAGNSEFAKAAPTLRSLFKR